MSKSVDMLLYNEMKKDDDDDLMADTDLDIGSIDDNILDGLMDDQSIGEAVNELFPSESKYEGVF